MAGIVNLLYRTFPALGRWLAKDTSPDEAITSVLTAPPSNDLNKGPEATKMFCTEFVENTMSIAASQSLGLFDQWKVHRRSQYLPPGALADHLKIEDLAEEVRPDELNISLTRMFK